jgi:O-antigen ligase
MPLLSKSQHRVRVLLIWESPRVISKGRWYHWTFLIETGHIGSSSAKRRLCHPSMKPIVTAASSIACWLLYATVALAPLPFGSVEPTATAIWCVVLGLCLVMVPVRNLGAGQSALAGLAAAVVSAYAIVLREQLAQHPWFATPDPIWEQAKIALGMALTPSVAVARDQPWFALGRPLTCVLALSCGFLIGHSAECGRRLFKVVAWSGAAYAAYGILSHVFDPSHILGREKHAYLESVTGTFVNRNTAGAYFGTCAVIWSLLLWGRVRQVLPSGRIGGHAATAEVLLAPPRNVVVAFAMLFLCLAAMFMTRSRGAVLVSLVVLLVAFVAYFYRDLPRRGSLFAVLATGSLVVVILLQLMGEGVNARFDLQGLADEGRLETYKSTLQVIWDHPWVGTGLGTFAQVFPAYRSANASLWGTWDMAHNTLLEIAAEMGLPIAALVVVAWATIFGVLLRGIGIRCRNIILPAGALATGLLATLHSLVDFSLQIPGYAIVVLSLVGAGLAQSFRRRRGVEEKGTPIGTETLEAI